MKKIWKGTVLIIMLIIFVGCGASNQKEAIPYSKMSELDTDSISSPEYLIKVLGSPNRTITEAKDMEAIINGYIKNIEHPESKGNKVNDAVNNVSYSQLIELAEKRLEIVSSFENSENFKALEYRSINSDNEEYNNYFIFNDNEYVVIFWDDVPYVN